MLPPRFIYIWILLCFCLSLAQCQLISAFGSSNSKSLSENNMNLNPSSFKRLVESATTAIEAHDFDKSAALLLEALKINDRDIFACQLLGTVYARLKKPSEAIFYLNRSLDLSGWDDPLVGANYIEVLRASGQVNEAYKAGLRLIRKHPDSEAILYFNFGVVHESLNDIETAAELHLKAIQLNPKYMSAWKNLFELYINDLKRFDKAESLAREGVRIFTGKDQIYFMMMLGLSLQFAAKLDEAIDVFQQTLLLDPTNYNAKASLGAVYQVYGKAQLALETYESAMPFKSNDAAIRNNYGALLGVMGRREEEIEWLKEALTIEPNMAHALVNLGGYYQDEGKLEEAEAYLQRAVALNYQPTILSVRMSLLLYPVVESWKQMITSRNMAIARVSNLISNLTSGVVHKDSLDASIDRIHFYIVYHGLNDRHFQELVAQAYRLSLSGFEMFTPHLAACSPSLWDPIQPTATATTKSQFGDSIRPQRFRIGFISKFFGIFEPHALLLDGIMRNLPRDRFEVYALPVSRTDPKPVTPSIVEAADVIVDISLKHEHALLQLDKLDLDVLVFADTMSEPITHFLAHSRIAKLQLSFWGNPITSASHHMDYFVSADVMEHPFRTRMPVAMEPYSEQVVLIGGQGIWYYRPEDSAETLKRTNITLNLAPRTGFNRSNFDFGEDWFIFFIPQSVFKMHPLFDGIIMEILRDIPFAHVVVTGGRRQRWTSIYSHRLYYALGGSGSPLLSRLHMIPRVSSEKFIDLLNICDVVLHPFPFDGSRTSADVLVVGKPFITLPSEYLRGRMGQTFLRTMNIPELVAHNRSEYVSIAVQLATSPTFYNQITRAIAATVDLIWEDMEVPYEWTNMLSCMVGLPPMQLDEYLQTVNKDVDKEMKLIEQRKANRKGFAESWGSEDYLLRVTQQEGANALSHPLIGVSVLEERLSDEQIPMIFNNWKSVSFQSNNTITVALPAFAHFVETPSKAIPRTISLQAKGAAGADNLFNGMSTGDAHHDDAMGQSVSTINKDWIVDTIREYSRQAQYDHAYNLALAYKDSFANDPGFIFEFGAIQFFRGDYQAAYDHCKYVVENYFFDSVEANTCLGVSAMYLDRRDESINALVKALKIDYSRRDLGNNQTTPSLFLFKAQRPSIESNLLSALASFKRSKDCVDMATMMASLPRIDAGGIYIAVFSAVDWSPMHYQDIDNLELALRRSGSLQLPLQVSLMSEIRRLQRDMPHIQNQMIDCMCDYLNHVDVGLKEKAITDLMMIVKSSALTNALDGFQKHMQAFSDKIASENVANSPSSLTSALSVRDIYSRAGLSLVTQHFNSSNVKVVRDMSRALQLNLNNPAISQVYLLNEMRFNYSRFNNSWKIKQFVIKSRLTFTDAFEFASVHLANRTVAVVNSDIYFDESIGILGDMRTLNLGKTILALSKWANVGQAKELSLQLRTNSQDAWIFKAPLSFDAVVNSNFHLGRSRCDNRLAYVLSYCGYELVNPAFAIHAIETQSSERAGSFYGMKGSVPGAVKDVLLSDRYFF